MTRANETLRYLEDLVAETDDPLIKEVGARDSSRRAPRQPRGRRF
jgi:hypothetical protein